MTINQFLPKPQRLHLVEEEIAQAVVDETVTIELDAQGQVGLTPAHDHRPGIDYFSESCSLGWHNNRPFRPLECEDQLVSLSSQAFNLRQKPIGIAWRRSG